MSRPEFEQHEAYNDNTDTLTDEDAVEEDYGNFLDHSRFFDESNASVCHAIQMSSKKKKLVYGWMIIAFVSCFASFVCSISTLAHQSGTVTGSASMTLLFNIIALTSLGALCIVSIIKTGWIIIT